MRQVFISHASEDNVFVHELSQALRLLDEDIWIDSRELRGGDPLWPEIQQAIMDAAAYVVVVSPAALQSKWVDKELKFALKQQKKRGKKKFRVIPLSLNGTRLGVLKPSFGKKPLYTPVSSAAGGVDAALHPILVALGKRLPTDPQELPQPPAMPLEELVLELGDLKFQEEDGKRRACGRARLVYEPATPGQETVRSTQDWIFVAPLGPIEADELRWYLEKYAIWPSENFRNRATQVESQLVAWGRALHDAALPVPHTANVLQAWARIDDRAGRRFSVHIDTRPIAGTAEADIKLAREAATALLGLPWELLHDGSSFLFQGAQPTRVRRRLPNTQGRSVPVVAPPIRILLITARPENEACGYIDHRASALPLVDAVEELGGLVQLHILSPATLPALRKELARARQAGTPYHVVHFDGHGVYNRQVGLGGLCFEKPEDDTKLERRGHSTVYTNELGPLLKGHRIPLVFLEACQSALAEAATDSVATALLQEGVASVVAMSHSVLVATARRFVAQFYRALAQGERVGSAMLAGQRHLKDDTLRGHIFGAGELRLEDWFVPVLFQEKNDPQLFQRLPTPQTRDDFLTRRKALLGALPPEPATRFVGRSRELLALERLLHHQRYAVIRGQGGEGKTALAAEFARWWVRSQQIERAVFVSVESHGTVMALLDALGRQLLPHSAATYANQEQAILPIERALREQDCLLVIDNMESVLLPPYLETPEALSAEAVAELNAILTLCKQLNAIGATRLIFTSREALPAPFDAAKNRRELQQLAEEDAIKLVERALSQNQEGAGSAAHAEREAIAELVATVHSHARTLALLGPNLRSLGVPQTQANLSKLMAEMQRRFPGQREHSLFASVELSLQRLSPENRERVGVLGVFYGGFSLAVLGAMMQWDETAIASLAEGLLGTGLATAGRYAHLTLNPALCPYLRAQLADQQMAELLPRWVAAMRTYVKFLDQQQHQNTQLAATLTGLELPNLFALLGQVQQAGDAEATIGLTTSMHTLLQSLGKPRLMERVAQARDATTARFSEHWNHARFEAQRTLIEQQLATGHFRETLVGAQDLLQRARKAGEHIYASADYDLAGACWLLALVRQTVGDAESALPLLDEAQQRFEAVERRKPGCGAARMASVCIAERGKCLLDLGRLNDAAIACEEAIRRAEQRNDERSIAVDKSQLGGVRLLQKRYDDALSAFTAAREAFTLLDEPGGVAKCWHQTGRVLQGMGQPQAAEEAYLQALTIEVRLGDTAGQALTLSQLGNLYVSVLGRTEEAVAFYRQAADKYGGKDTAHEGKIRNNLAATLLKLQRYDEARQEIKQAVQYGASFGHAAEPWKSWDILAAIETATHNPNAAAAAQQKATASYLAYRCDGGENHHPDGRLSLAISQALHANKPDEASTLLRQLTAEPQAAHLLPFIQALQALLAGSRDPVLADTPGLDYTMAAEILWLIETLPKPV